MAELAATGQTRLNQKRLQIRVNGIVQGVGFRPFVFSLAREHSLSGTVSNTSAGVSIEVQGPAENLEQFQKCLEEDAPPLSFITETDRQELEIIPRESDFTILPSNGEFTVSTLISPDVATCPDCIAEIFDPSNRRYHYPFTNCTNCGPRYTIIENIPYDRPYTSMRHFPMCPACQHEYEDPHDRRFHAQPNACPECGPRIWLCGADGAELATQDVLRKTAQALRDGKIIAMKGLGGFHLVVDASNEDAVRTLRRRKGREAKPLALMVRDLDTARYLVEISDAEVEILTSLHSPITLLKRKLPNGLVAGSVAPGNDRLGIMLPYTPLHHLLLTQAPPVLVMTSANLSEEPICIDNEEARQRLSGIADLFLLHNRDIYLRTDDSVVTHQAGQIRPIRRSRGYAPRPIIIPGTGPPILATGGELKNTLCLLRDRFAFLSQHVGDLENLEAYDFFQKTAEHLQRIFEVEPELIVHDLHPAYLSTRWAKEQEIAPTIAVQHHHAHLASVMAEHGVTGKTLGIILDGTGYGTDGSIWGGEFLLGDFSGFIRAGSLEPLLLPGGDAAIRAPWRVATAYLMQVFEDEEFPRLPFMDDHDLTPIQQMLQREFQTVATTSMGRLFDAVAAMSGGCPEIQYEAQAAIEFMQAADGELSHRAYPISIMETDAQLIWEIRPLLRAVARDVQRGRELATISCKFHRTLVEGIVEMAREILMRQEPEALALSGGVFQNELLFESLLPRLEELGVPILTHQQVPTNDGGLALGQVMLGRYHLTNATQ